MERCTLKNKSKLFLTLDVEEWFHVDYRNLDLNKYQYDGTNLEDNIDRFILLCARNNIKSTCFVLGKVAERKPRIVDKLFKAGHEIASHGYEHRLIYDMNPKEFEIDLIKSCNILQDIIGEKVLGFRAPCWSVNMDVLSWFYPILEAAGIKYSSSVYPAKTFLYGIPGFPEKAHYPNINGTKSAVIEVPVPIVNIFGIKVGFSGGFYFGIFPLWFIKKCVKENINKGNMVFIYLHPREIDTSNKKSSLPVTARFIHYVGVNGCYNKLVTLLELYSFGRLKDVGCKLMSNKGAIY